MISGIIQALESFLAGLLDKLKVGSPLTFVLLITVIFGGAATIENYTELGESLPWLFEGVVPEVIKGLVAILINTRTKRHMDVTDDSGEGFKVMDIDYDD